MGWNFEKFNYKYSSTIYKEKFNIMFPDKKSSTNEKYGISVS